MRNILVDAGKFFYHSAMQWFPAYAVRTIDAVVLTHAHADAAGGLDDLRDWTNYVGQPFIPIHAPSSDMPILEKTHYYLVDRANKTSGGSVAKLQFVETSEEPFDVAGIKFVPLPVWHGRPYRSHGYRFGSICYVPDVSEIPDETRQLMQGCEVLIIDALRRYRTHGSHYTLEQAMDEVRRIRPKKTYFTDMCHDIVHERDSRYVRSVMSPEGLDVEFAYDGLSFEADL